MYTNLLLFLVAIFLFSIDNVPEVTATARLAVAAPVYPAFGWI